MPDAVRKPRSSRPTRARSVLPGLVVTLAAFSLLLPRDARAQAGAEAAAQAKQAADWAKQQQQSDASAQAPTPRVRLGRPEPPPPPPPPPTRVTRKLSGAPGRVDGVVLERKTGRPVAGIHLSLTSTEPQYVVETFLARTDSAGRYEFPAVEPGRWSLAVVHDRLPRGHAAARGARILTVARRDSVIVPPIALTPTGCVAGNAVWADGYVFSDAPVTVAPRDTSLPVVEGAVDGIGDFEICSVPADSAMVWLLLRDGRRLGLPVSLAPGRNASVHFRPQPLDRMDGTALRIEARTPAGEPVIRARILVVGRRLAAGKEPVTVFVREATADRAGGADFRLPYGTYEILAVNPREGPHARVEQFVIARGVPPQVTHEVTLRGTSTPEQRAAWRGELLERAERFQRAWGL